MVPALVRHKIVPEWSSRSVREGRSGLPTRCMRVPMASSQMLASAAMAGPNLQERVRHSRWVA
jgi:hypothetical protein